MSDALDAAARAVASGDLVVYPTETVYGLGADALDPDAVDRVFEAKGRPRDDPISMAVPDVATALDHTRPSDRAEAFMREFLPGPATVVVPKCEQVPDALVGGRDRVGIRIPDHDLALALLARAGPTTSTSANRSGTPSARRAADVDPVIREAAAVVLDGGETGGAESTVVDPDSGELPRRGALADEIEAWLQQRA